MKKKLPVIFIRLVVLFLGICGFLIWQKSQTKLPPAKVKTAQEAEGIKMVDLSTQPEWVQKLDVTAVTGRSANGLKNVTITAKGMPAGQVSTIDYVVEYQTTNKGSQGSLSSQPVEINGATTFSRTIDFGTCSTKSCVVHKGVTSVDVELDFTTTSGDKATWTKTLPL